MIIHYTEVREAFYTRPNEMKRSDIRLVTNAGWQWFDEAKLWVTTDPYRALALFEASEATLDEIAFEKLAEELQCIRDSHADYTSFDIARPRGQHYLDYQKVGILNAERRFIDGFKAHLLGDPMGLGKSVMACGLVNRMNLDPAKVLVVCPASLRINWQRELDKWMINRQKKAFPVLPGCRSGAVRDGTLIVSYEATLDDSLMATAIDYHWALVIFDESQYLKSPEAKRTQACLAIAKRANHVLMLSGTPIPNRAHEFYSTLNALAPDVSGGMTEHQFQQRYTVGEANSFGWKPTGGRNHEELYCRLRGSGFMTRRDKRKVLPQLPPERHNMIVFPPTAGTARVVKKERDNVPFTAAQIIEAGQPLGYGAIPELRHEMGLEKLPQAVSWIKDQLDNGCEKMVVFGYHRDVLDGLQLDLWDYNPGLVYGATAMTSRQLIVDAFQETPGVRVLIGGWKPLGVGWTLTAADTVVFVESSFVPGQNDQCKDRLVRMGQEAQSVNIYHLVVEGSIDASVLAAAAGKQYDIGRVLG